MATPQQGDADPVALLLAWLRGHSEFESLLGGAEHVSGVSETPWPHLVIDDGLNGDLRDFRWDAELEVSLVLYGHPEGGPGKSAMRKTMFALLALIARWPDEQTVSATDPVVSRVRPGGGLPVWQTLTSGQQRLEASVYVTIRPPSRYPEDWETP